MILFIKKLSALPILLFAILLLLPGFSFGQSLTDYCQNPANKNADICAQLQKSNDTGAKAGGTLIGEQQSNSNQKVSIPNPLGVSTFADLIAKINNWLIWIGAPILTLMVLIGAFQIMFAGSNPDKVTEGRHTITWAVVGYGLLLISSGIVFIIKDILGAR